MALDLKEGLTTKVGPLPVWVYGIAAGAGVAIWMRVRSKRDTTPAEADVESQYVGWGAAPYVPGVASPGSGGFDYADPSANLAEVLLGFDQASAERFEETLLLMDERRSTDLANFLEISAAQEERTRQLIEAMRESSMQAAQPPPPPMPAPAPNPAPVVNPAPAAPKAYTKGQILWHGSVKPNLETIRKAHPGVALRLIDNKGHAPNSPSRYVVVVA